jgi:hypothetical protein
MKIIRSSLFFYKTIPQPVAQAYRHATGVWPQPQQSEAGAFCLKNPPENTRFSCSVLAIPPIYVPPKTKTAPRMNGRVTTSPMSRALD